MGEWQLFFPTFSTSKTKHWQQTALVIDACMTRSRCQGQQRGAALCGLPVWGTLETLIFGCGLWWNRRAKSNSVTFSICFFFLEWQLLSIEKDNIVINASEPVLVKKHFLK